MSLRSPRPSALRWLRRRAAWVVALGAVVGCAKVVSNACRPGPHHVAQVDYDFPGALNITPPGTTTPAYPNVDVRATVRYPGTASGVAAPVAGSGRYPLIVFLHGNHVTCDCSCSHSCGAGSRVPSYQGYNYLLDMLASWGFIVVSVDGFNVTCAGSPAMTDYEARGRLVLHHLQRWQDWDAHGTDPWGGRFRNRVDMAKIGLSGHSRGGEGVVAAEYINRAEAWGFQIKAVNAIAPTDQDPYIHYVPQVPYFLLLGSSDGDVWNLQGLRTYDRTSLGGAVIQSEKEMAWVYGANHNFFNTVWTPKTCPWPSDDGNGSGRLSPALQRLTACQTIVPFFMLHLKHMTRFRKLFRGEHLAEGLEGVRMYFTYQDPVRLEVDSFGSGQTPTVNSLGGAVTTSGGFTTFGEYDFKQSGTVFNGSFFHFTRGLVLAYSSEQTYETVLPVGRRDVSSYSALSMRISQILDGGVLNPTDAPRTLRVTLQTTSGTVANVDFDVTGVHSVPYPYPDNGGKTVLGMIRIPLASFRDHAVALPLDDIERVVLQFPGSGQLAIDDIQFTK